MLRCRRINSAQMAISKKSIDSIKNKFNSIKITTAFFREEDKPNTLWMQKHKHLNKKSNPEKSLKHHKSWLQITLQSYHYNNATQLAWKHKPTNEWNRGLKNNTTQSEPCCSLERWPKQFDESINKN